MSLKKSLIVLTILCTLVLTSTLVYAAPDAQKTVDKANAKIEKAIDKAQAKAEKAKDVDKIIDKLVEKTDKTAQKAKDKAEKDGADVKCEDVEVDVGGTTVAIDPLHVYSW